MGNQDPSKKSTVDQIENDLLYLSNRFSKEAVEAAIIQQANITPKLLAWLDNAIQDVDSVQDGYIPKILQNAIFGLLLFLSKARLKTRNRVDYYSLLIGPWTKKSSRPKHSILKHLGYIGHFFSVFLLSQFQEKNAFTSIISLARLPEKNLDLLIGDCITEDLHRFIAATYKRTEET